MSCLLVGQTSFALGVGVFAAGLERTLVFPPGNISPVGLKIFQEFLVVFQVLSESNEDLFSADAILSCNSLVPLGLAEMESAHSI